MIPFVYALLLGATGLVLWRHFRGRTVEGLIRRPPAGSDLNALVSTLSYLEHELIKHRIPVVRSLCARRLWNADDWRLLGRTLGRGATSLSGELHDYLDELQRAAGRTLINFGRDRAFTRAERALEAIQRTGERWMRHEGGNGPPKSERESVDSHCAWLSGPFRHYLVEINRSVFRCSITRDRLLRSGRRGLSEAGRDVALTVEEPPDEWVAHVLPSDLDVIMRNLVRNAAQANADEGDGPAIDIEVRQQLEETGEESLLIGVHDRNSRILSASDIYGREASRGLGLVTAALARHRGAVRCRPSDRPGFAKVMEVRLRRSLHEPDRQALELGRPPAANLWLPVGAVALHGLLLALVVAPWLSPHPLAEKTLSTPEGCVVDDGLNASAITLICDPFGPDGALRREPIQLTFDDPAASPGQPMVRGSQCLEVSTAPDRGVVAIDVLPCLRGGELEPSATLRFSTPWRQSDYEIRVALRSAVPRLLTAIDAALRRGDADLARRLADYLVAAGRSLAPSERHAALALRTLIDVAATLDERWGAQPAPDETLCRRFAGVEERLDEMIGLAGDREPVERGPLVAEARMLLGMAALFMTASLEGAANVLAEVASTSDEGGASQTARLILAALVAEGVPAPDHVHAERLLAQLWESYQRPIMKEDRVSSFTILIPVLGERSLYVPVPEALCAFRHHYPDVRLAAGMAGTLARTCGSRPIEPGIDSFVGRLGAFIRHPPSPVACPRRTD